MQVNVVTRIIWLACGLSLLLCIACKTAREKSNAETLNDMWGWVYDGKNIKDVIERIGQPTYACKVQNQGFADLAITGNEDSNGENEYAFIYVYHFRRSIVADPVTVLKPKDRGDSIEVWKIDYREYVWYADRTGKLKACELRDYRETRFN